MQSPSSTNLTAVPHMQGHILGALATWPGGLTPDVTITEAVARLRPIFGDIHGHSDALEAAEVFQGLAETFAADETDHNYSNLVDSFYAFRKMEFALCKIIVQ